ncbi:MAG TPA: pilin [Candidatus Saccharimonadales bacterium]
MIQKFRNYALSIVLALTFAAPILVPSAVYASEGSANTCSDIGNNVATGANQAAGDASNSINCAATGVDSNSIGKIAQNVVKIFSILVGAVSVIMIIYGGFRYITSGGDSGRVGNAKNTLIYALVGLVIVALAQLIVHFVLNQSTNITTG